MSPVVIKDLRPVVFLDSKYPSAQGALVNTKLVDKIKVMEHSNGCLQHLTQSPALMNLITVRVSMSSSSVSVKLKDSKCSDAADGIANRDKNFASSTLDEA